MGLHGLYDFFWSAELLEDAAADLDVGAGDFMVESFADIVQECSGLGYLDIGAELLGYHAGDMGHLYGVLEDILAVAGAEMEPAQDEQYARIEADDATFIGGCFALFLYGLIYILSGLFHYLFYPSRLDAAIFYEFFQCHASYMAADRIK
jgi:hypothetical protein